MFLYVGEHFALREILLLGIPKRKRYGNLDGPPLIQGVRESVNCIAHVTTSAVKCGWVDHNNRTHIQ